MDRSEDLSIGRLAARSGVKVTTIRYYEKGGLLPPPPRSAGGHRVYGPWHVQRLRFIRRGRELGFSLEDVAALLKLTEGGDFSCDQVMDITLQHLSTVRDKIADLRQLEKALIDLAERCETDTGPDCPILDALFADMPASA